MHQIKLQSFLLSLFFGLFSSTLSFANTSTTAQTETVDHSFCHPIVVLTGGAAFTNNLGHSKNIPAHDGVFSYFNYAAHHENHSQSLFGVFLGAEFLLHPDWSLQAGFGYYEPSAFNINGLLTQGVDTASENQYPYKYSIQNQQFLVESKLLYNCHCFHPYLSAGIGAAINHSKNYYVNIQPPFTTFSNQFENKRINSFSYTLGFGFDVDIHSCVRLGLGYRFAYLGDAKTGIGLIDNVGTTNTLAQHNLSTNEALAQLTIIL